MSLTPAEIAELGRLLDGSRFNEMALEMGGFRLKMRRGGKAVPRSAPAPVPVAAPVTATLAAPPPVIPASVPAAGEVDVPAPFIGNFYRAPRPGEPSFVEVGQKVTEDSVIGIIEVMKLMNTVRAGVSGTVVAVLAANAAAVEEGQPLIRVAREG